MNMSPELMTAILGTVGASLMGGNIYFVKRLVDKIDATEKSVTNLAIKMARMEGLLFKGESNGSAIGKH
jgi:hypothetical protein